MSFRGGVDYFIDIVPGGGIEDVGITVRLALGEYGEQMLRRLVSCWAEVEAV